MHPIFKFGASSPENECFFRKRMDDHNLECVSRINVHVSKLKLRIDGNVLGI